MVRIKGGYTCKEPGTWEVFSKLCYPCYFRLQMMLGVHMQPATPSAIGTAPLEPIKKRSMALAMRLPGPRPQQCLC